jgi:T4 RnlA family RNA ligase
MFNTELGLFCYMHDNWEELLTQEPYYLKIKEDGPYVIFNYDQLKSDFNNPIVQEARGIIFRRDNWSHPICWAFNKFFNAQEPNAAEIDWSTAFVSEKIDGSIIKVWWDWSSGWHISTNGIIDAYKAELGDARMPSFGDYFEIALNKYYSSFADFVENLEFDYTYIFELVGPYNRVVIPYDEPDLYFLGARNKFTGEEFNCSSLIAGGLGMGRFKLPKQYPLTSLNDCINRADTYSWDQEGFVVADAKGNRVKVKSPAYVMAHFARNNNVITRKHLIKIILMNEVEEFLCYADEYKDALQDVQKLMRAYINIGNTLAISCRKVRSMSRGAFSEYVKIFPKIFQGLMYFNYERDMTVEEYTSKWHVNKWEDYLLEVKKLGQECFK